MSITMHDARPLPLGQVRAAPWNANKVSRKTLEKIRRSLSQFGAVENVVVRPGWCVGCRTSDDVDTARAAQALSVEPEWYEVLSGNHRLAIYAENGVEEVRAVVVELSDPRAKLLAQAMNRLGGKDDPDKLIALLQDVMRDETPADISALLPHSERDLLGLLDGSDEEVAVVPEGPVDSKVGTIYELGPHRVLCGDATDERAVAELLAGRMPTLMVTDPPYGVELAQGWRDSTPGSAMSYQPTSESCGFRAWPRTAQDDRLRGDDGFDWVPALGLPKADIAYLWHAGAHSREAEDALAAHGFEIRQQIIWRKTHHVVGRAAYHWQHEPCWYAVRKGKTAHWLGGNNQTTVWDAPSPKQIMGRFADHEAKVDHPTQKPLICFQNPIVNHLNVGEVVYDPFMGSGTALIAAAKADRVCFGVEIEPKYVDLIRRRWTGWARNEGRDPGTGALGG